MLTVFAMIVSALAVSAISPLRAQEQTSSVLAVKPKPEPDPPTERKSRFPAIEGRSIDGRIFHLPEDFAGLYNVVVLTYDIDQQVDAVEWFARLRAIETTYPDVKPYELPIVGELPWMTRQRREFRMSSDTADPQIRAHTITLGTDAHAFNDQLGIYDRAQITVLLVDRFGRLFWRERGPCTTEKIDKLENAIVNLLENVRIYAEN